jgi:hypothetical protein
MTDELDTGIRRYDDGMGNPYKERCLFHRIHDHMFDVMVIIPVIQMPAVAVMMEPVQGAIGDVKVAFGMERAGGGVAIHHVEQAGMADHGELLVGVMFDQPVENIEHPLGEVGQAFASFKIKAHVACLVEGIGLGISLGSFGFSYALKDAVVPLAELWQCLDCQIFALRQRLGGFHGARQVTAEQGGEAKVRGVIRHGKGLGTTGVVQRDVDVPLNASFLVPVGFAVANDANFGTHRSKI